MSKVMPRAQSHASTILRAASWLSLFFAAASVMVAVVGQLPGALAGVVGGVISFAALRALAITSDAALIAARATIDRTDGGTP